MSQDKSSLDELIWLYRLNQAPLHVAESGAEPFLRTGGYHMFSEDCPCLPWADCDCPCHEPAGGKGVEAPVTPVA
jgi:hypothetical protein